MKKTLLTVLCGISSLFCGAQSIPDVIPHDYFTTTYNDISYKSATTAVDYLLRGEADSGVILFDKGDNNSTGGVTADGGDMLLEKITFEWNEDWWSVPQDECKLIVYAATEPYATVRDLYVAGKCGTEIARAEYPSTEITIDGDYSIIGLATESPGRYDFVELTSLTFHWKQGAKEIMEPLTATTASGHTLDGLLRYAISGPTKITLASATPDVRIDWCFGERSGSSVGPAEVEIPGAGTLSAVATREGYTSREFAVEVVESSPIASVYDAWQVYPMATGGNQECGEVFEAMFDATVVYAANVLGDGLVIINDGTNFSRMFIKGREV
ncbi:MAG: hypothetical protein K2L27_02360, partial [Muribaculaceae bacterium]|nr:hypothetical protein [Muribaculaceae bacterium]